MVGGGWFLPFLSNWVILFCLYLRNRLSYRAGIGPVLKLWQLSFRWDQPQLCSFIRLEVITKNVIYTANVPYTHILIVYIYCFAYISRTNWATELGLVPNESTLIKVFRFYIIWLFLCYYSHIIRHFLRKSHLLDICGPKIHLVLIISQKRIERQSWDWSQMKALCLRFPDLL